jgi:hypothetical protein
VGGVAWWSGGVVSRQRLEVGGRGRRDVASLNKGGGGRLTGGVRRHGAGWHGPNGIQIISKIV